MSNSSWPPPMQDSTIEQEKKTATWVGATLRTATWPMPDDVQRLRVERKLLQKAMDCELPESHAVAKAASGIGTMTAVAAAVFLFLARSTAPSAHTVALAPIKTQRNSTTTTSTREQVAPAVVASANESETVAAVDDSVLHIEYLRGNRRGQSIRENHVRLAPGETVRAEIAGATLELSQGAWLAVEAIDANNVKLNLMAGKASIHFASGSGKSLAVRTPLARFDTAGASFALAVMSHGTTLSVGTGAVKATQFLPNTTHACAGFSCANQREVALRSGAEFSIASQASMDANQPTVETAREQPTPPVVPEVAQPEPTSVATTAARPTLASALGTPDSQPRADHEGVLLLLDTARRDLNARHLDAARARVRDLLETPVDRETRVEALLLLADTYRFGSPQHAADINRQAVSLSRGSAREAHALFELAYVLEYFVHDSHSALVHYRDLLRVENDSSRATFARQAIARLSTD